MPTQLPASPAGVYAVIHFGQPPQKRQQPPCSQRNSRSSIGHWLLSATRRAWARYWAVRARRATAGILHRLDDRALKDIGLDRSEIESVVYGDCQRHGSRLTEGHMCM